MDAIVPPVAKILMFGNSLFDVLAKEKLGAEKPTSDSINAKAINNFKILFFFIYIPPLLVWYNYRIKNEHLLCYIN